MESEILPVPLAYDTIVFNVSSFVNLNDPGVNQPEHHWDTRTMKINNS